MTMRVEATATITEVLSQLRNRSSPRICEKVDSCHSRGRNVGGVRHDVALGRASELSSMTM